MSEYSIRRYILIIKCKVSAPCQCAGVKGDLSTLSVVFLFFVSVFILTSQVLRLDVCIPRRSINASSLQRIANCSRRIHAKHARTVYWASVTVGRLLLWLAASDHTSNNFFMINRSAIYVIQIINMPSLINVYHWTSLNCLSSLNNDPSFIRFNVQETTI